MKCEKYLSGISESWIKDSIGANGFRENIFKDIQKHCDFRGKKWKDLEPYFGKCNKIGSYLPIGIEYYSLNWNSLDKMRQVIIFELDKKDSTVLRFVKQERNCSYCD